MLDREMETSVLPTAERAGVGVIVFSVLAQGILTGKYNDGVPADSRVALGMGNGAIDADRLTPERLSKVKQLAALATSRRPGPGPDGVGLGVARSASDLGAYRREPSAAGFGSRQGLGKPRVFAGITGKDRGYPRRLISLCTEYI